MTNPKQLHRPVRRGSAQNRLDSSKAGKPRSKKTGMKRPFGFPLQEKGKAAGGGMLVARFLNKEGFVIVADVAQSFGMSKAQLAETAGVRPETLHRFSRAFAPRTQARLK